MNFNTDPGEMVWILEKVGGLRSAAFCLGAGTMQQPLNCWIGLEREVLQRGIVDKVNFYSNETL